MTASTLCSDIGLARRRSRALAAAGLGTAVEFFDYASYSYLATTLAVVFFPAEDKASAILQTFVVFALSFAMRPIGGLFWGQFGDRLGRKKVMLLTITGMGLATVAIGSLPGYATIGIWAPILLIVIRMMQSFCTAGQYAGAAVVAGEFAPPSHRGRYVYVVPIGAAAGFMLASGLTSGLHNIMSYHEMVAWGWRIPFVAGGGLTLIGWFVQQAFEETPDFQLAQNVHEVADLPIASLFREHGRLVLSLLCIISVGYTGYYLVMAYMATYLEVERGFSAADAGAITSLALVAYIPLLYAFAAASDRWGRKVMLIASSALFLVGSYPAFLILASGGFGTALFVQLCLVTFLALFDSTFAAYFVESFPTNVRLSGFALPFNLGAALFGGAAPLAADWLIQQTGNEMMPAFLMMGVAMLSLLALLLRSDAFLSGSMQRQYSC